MEIKVTAKDDLLKRLIRSLTEGVKVKVGVFDNEIAGYAVKMELGSSNEYVPEIDKTVNIPPRSFLYVPIEENLEAELKGQIKKEDLVNDIKSVGKTVGEVAKDIVDATFQNEGYGKWLPNLPLWKDYKQAHGFDGRILHKTGALADSIEYKVGD